MPLLAGLGSGASSEAGGGDQAEDSHRRWDHWGSWRRRRADDSKARTRMRLVSREARHQVTAGGLIPDAGIPRCRRNSDALGVARSATPSHCWWSDSGRRNTAVPAGDHAGDTDAVVHEMSNERRASRSPCAKVLEFSENLSPLGLIVRVRN